MNKDFVTTFEAAERLGVSHRRVYQLIEAGKLKAEHFGKIWLIHAQSLNSVQTYGRPGRPPKAESAKPVKKTRKARKA